MWSVLLASGVMAQELETVSVGADLIPMVGTSARAQGNERRELSLNVVGYTGAVDGIELGFFANVDRFYMHGVQLAGVGNLVGTDMEGIQLSGGLNLVGQDTDGVQVTGGASLVGGGLEGFQVSGGLNLIGLDMEGFQAVGGANIVGGAVYGFQGAGGANIAGGMVDGAQLAGFLNVAGGVNGTQVGALNVSSGHVDGVQVGVVNVARSADFSLGLVNIIWEGRTHVDAWVTEDAFANMAFKHGGDRFHYIYGGGVRAIDALPLAWRGAVGIGGHSPIGTAFFLDADLITAYTHAPALGPPSLDILNTARTVIGLSVTDRLAVTAGTSYNLQITDACGPKYGGPGTTVFRPGPVQVRGWPGFMVGVQLL